MKAFWKSKTLWANVAALAVHYVGVVPVNPMVLAMANVVLRLITTQGLTASEK